MQRINPEKLRDGLGAAIAIIDIDISTENIQTRTIDKAARSVLSLLMIILDKSTERIVDEEIKDLKERLLRLEGEVARLYRKLRIKTK